MQPDVKHNQPEYSVSEISARVKRSVEEEFSYVRVRGEISRTNVNAGSGHCYLTLKDEHAVLDAACWKGTMSKLAHKPEVGMEVIATGKLSTYAKGKSSYQLIIDALEPAGVGALMAMLEQRKRQFEKEGLFAPERKRPIPFLPEVIGIITSPTGAVIRDMLHRLADRFPRQVLLWPVAVQGQGAAEQVAAAIQGLNQMEKGRPDLLIVARGGGSIEDLWAFNEEIVVRAVAASAIPVISAIGHETDTTLIDYVADKRAPTPTGAAEFAVPVRSELLSTIDMLHARQNAAWRKQLQHAQERVVGLARGLPRPQHWVASMAQSLDQLDDRLHASLQRWMAMRQERLQALARHLSPRNVVASHQRQQQTLDHLALRLEASMLRRLERQAASVETIAARLAGGDITRIMQRGFTLVRDSKGKVIRTGMALQPGQAVALQFHDGTRQATVDGERKKPTKLAAKQAGLFD